jgi:diguanylate cyclase (GGDEF)-like protein
VGTIVNASLQTVTAALERRTVRLRFPGELEQQYERDFALGRQRRVALLLTLVTIAYGLEYTRSCVLMPDVVVFSSWWHGAVIALHISFIAALLRKPVPAWLRESGMSALSVLVMVGFFATDIMTTSPLSKFMHFHVLIGIMFNNVIQRLQFRYAVATTILSFALYRFAVVHLHDLSSEELPAALSMLVFVSIMTLVANYELEKQSRRHYLTTLRERLRNEDLATANRDLMTAANLDPLTGLSNRRFLENFLEALWLKQRIGQDSTAILMLDIDHFKRFNDAHGHLAGDDCLRQVADAVRSTLRRDNDLAARYGGEEFLIVLPRTDFDQAQRTAERIRHAVERCKIKAPSGFVSVSIGVAASTRSARGFADLIGRADAALYGAKNAGRGRVWPPSLEWNRRDDHKLASVA